uniref:Methionine aminopeptidase 1 n=1 Tax=Rhizophora mucronata TaxID=61149 RepID=A0A2P2LX76_RHIMU
MEMLRYQKCVLKLSTAFAICSNGSPSIWPHPISPDTCIDHGLNGKDLSSLHHTNCFVSCLG